MEHCNEFEFEFHSSTPWLGAVDQDWRFSFAFLVIRALKCEAVNFIKFKLAGIPVRLFEYLDTAISIIACAPCMSHMPNVTSQGSHMM